MMPPEAVLCVLCASVVMAVNDDAVAVTPSRLPPPHYLHSTEKLSTNDVTTPFALIVTW
jgi:hypothetical protein